MTLPSLPRTLSAGSVGSSRCPPPLGVQGRAWSTGEVLNLDPTGRFLHLGVQDAPAHIGTEPRAGEVAAWLKVRPHKQNLAGPVFDVHQAVVVVAAFTCFRNLVSMQHLAGRGTPRGTIGD